jgi:hypothetical protein
MKQCFTHRLPSSVTLLNDPSPDPAEARAHLEKLRKDIAGSMTTKSGRLPKGRHAASRS